MHAFLFLPLAAALAPQVPIPYPSLTNNRREVVNFNVETVRGLAQAPNGTLFALNTHGSQIVFHGDLGPAPEAIFQTIHNPVSIATWGSTRLVVAGAGTHALALHDSMTGDILNVLQLPSEPADLVVHPTLNVAFVACQGSNVVVRVNLSNFTITDTYPIPSERPRFLFLDDNQTPSNANDDIVFVAPFLSGNGSAVLPQTGKRDVIGDSYVLPPGSRLPDEDLFRVGVAPGSVVTAVKRRIGTMITAHGRNPNTGLYWALNIDSNNQDPLRPNEPKLRGDFAENRLWVGATPAGISDALLTEQRDLDDANGDGAYKDDGSESVAFPFGLAFEQGGTQRAYICSPLNDKVSVRAADGSFVSDIALPEGSIPFDIEVDRVFNTFLFVHCWGTNKIQAIVRSNPAIRFELDLGVDPTPAPISRGRTLWYDGAFSRNSRASCNTCHPGGKSDFLGWQVSDDPTDLKDVMVTQSLLGIEDTFPYHWRGERALVDFNGAFVDLLGGKRALTEGPGSEFEDFQAFVFSLQPHANPRQIIEREIPVTNEFVGFDMPTHVDAIPQPMFGDAQTGLSLYDNVIGFNAQSCAECHSHQTGSNGDFIDEVDTDIPSAKVLETPHLRELFHKDQSIVSISFGGVTSEFARTGFGTAHSGAALNIFRFILGGASFNLTPQESAHVAAFVRRFDQGIAPAAHTAVMLNANTQGFINGLLRDQASDPKHWIDLVAFGRFAHPVTGAQTVGRFVFTNTQWTPVLPPMLLRSNIGTVGLMDLPTLVQQTATGAAQLVFLGVPPGSGPRFALDPDNDNLTDWNEPVFGTNPFIADTDGDGDPDGYEVNNGGNPTNQLIRATDVTDPVAQGFVDFKSASLVKFQIEATEDVRIDGFTGVAGGPLRPTSTPVFARRHTFVVQGLQPSTPARLGLSGTPANNVVSLKLIDRAGRTFSYQTTVVGEDMILPFAGGPAESPVVLRSLTATKSSGGGSMTVSATATIQHRFDDPAGPFAASVGNKVAVFQVLTEDPLAPNFYVRNAALPTGTTTTAPDFMVVDGLGNSRLIDTAELQGPFLFAAPSAANGTLSLSFKVNGLSTGQKVRLRLIAILESAGSPGKFTEASLGRLQVPATAPGNRGVELAYP